MKRPFATDQTKFQPLMFTWTSDDLKRPHIRAAESTKARQVATWFLVVYGGPASILQMVSLWLTLQGAVTIEDLVSLGSTTLSVVFFAGGLFTWFLIHERSVHKVTLSLHAAFEEQRRKSESDEGKS